jgi:hypothetical protein
MKSKFKCLKILVCFLLTFMVAVGFFSSQVCAKSSRHSADDLKQVIDGVLTYRQDQAGVSSVQDLIDTKLTQSAGAGSSDWFMIALSRYGEGYDYDSYLTALEANVESVKNAKATDYQRMALVYSAAEQNSDYIKNILKEDTGQFGIMSYIYGLILLDSGDYSDKDYSREDIIDQILKLKLSDGGWALTGSVSDIDITAMALQALAPYREDGDVNTTVDKAITWLSKWQQDTGDYKSWGTRCCESTAQVIAALAALDIDCQTDERFVKKSNSLIDGLLLYKKQEGGFSHTIDGKADNTATVQAMYCLIATWRQIKGYSSFYDFANNGLVEIDRSTNNNSSEHASAPTDAETTSQPGAAASGNQAVPTIAEQSVTEQTTTAQTSTGQSTTGQSTLDQTASGQSTSGQSTGEQSTTEQTTAGQSASPTAEQSAETASNSADTAITKEASSGDHETTAVTKNLQESVTHRGFHPDYRVVLTILILIFGLLVIGRSFVIGKRSRKNYLTVFAIACAALAAVWGIRVQSVEDYYRVNDGAIQSESKVVTLSIRCDSVAGKKPGIGEDGIILDETEIPVKEGDSVLDVLILAAKQEKIPLDYEGGEDVSLSSAYVRGINDLYEYDFGDQSGWLYSVNGEFPGTNCGDYIVKAKDVIEWVYTCDFGKDVGRK